MIFATLKGTQLISRKQPAISQFRPLFYSGLRNIFVAMRKVIVSMNLTLDGYISGPDCGLDWHFNRWAPDMGERLAAELNRSDTILLGRVTYQAMASYWPKQIADTSGAREDLAFADLMNRHRKVVYSNTLRSADWYNSTLISGHIGQAVMQLKQSGGTPEKHIIIYGSGRLVRTLIRLGMVDEFQLWIHPVLLGKGKPLIKALRHRLGLQLVTTQIFGSGVVLLQYVPE